MRTTVAIALLGMLCSISACRASFEDIEKASLVSTKDNLNGKGNGDGTPDADPTLETDRELPREESPAYNCNGIVIVHEKGRDRNRDGVLQPTEVTEVSTSCRPDPNSGGGGKPDGGGKPGGGNPPGGGKDCPAQSGGKGGDKCPNQANQSDPSQAPKG